MAIGAISFSRYTCVLLGAVWSLDFRSLESEKDISMPGWYISLVPGIPYHNSGDKLIITKEVRQSPDFFEVPTRFELV